MSSRFQLSGGRMVEHTAFSKSAVALLEKAGTPRTGLASRTATGRMGQENALAPRRQRSGRLLLRQFTNPVTIVLILAAALSVVVSSPVEGLIILLIVLASAGVGFAQEWRAAVAMEDLLGKTRVEANVIRDGQEVEVSLEEVVPGDLVVLRAGDIIPADLALLSSDRLLVDEATITGESLPMEKGPVTDTSALGDDSGTTTCFFGSHVVSGTGLGLVTATGAGTRFGHLVEVVEEQDPQTQFERQMGSFSLMLTRVIAVLVVIVVVINLLIDRPVVESILFALAVGVGITPQLLPAITVVSLSVGARRMAEQKVLVKRLDAIEDIGGMTILCCDKTGTLTSGTVSLDRAIDWSGQPSDRVVRLAAMNAGLQTSFRNALDRAIAEKSPTVEGSAVGELPYDFERRRLSVLVREGDQTVLVTKGAVASVAEACSRYREGNELRALGKRARIRLEAQLSSLSKQGYRVLAVATKSWESPKDLTLADESEMVLEGLLVFSDPPTATAHASVLRLQEMGVDVAMITGDNRHIAAHVAQEVGMETDTVITGEQVDEMSDVELREAVTTSRVFAEIDPLQKRRVILALQQLGQTVGYLGDGINDVAALRAADVGISVEGASDAAKHASSLVILNKDLGVVAEGVELGRKTFSNTLKYIRVTISANFGNMVSLVIASAFLPFLPLLPAQILLLNFLSDIPALTLSSDRVDRAETSGPRTWNLRELRRFMLWFGLTSSIIDLSAFGLLFLVFGFGEEAFQTTWFVLSVITECLALLLLRTRQPVLRSRPATALLVASVVVVAVSFALPFTVLGGPLELVALSPTAVMLILSLGGAYLALNEVVKVFWKKRHPDSAV